MTPLLKKLAEQSGTELRVLELTWQACREAVIERYGRDKSGSFEYVRTALEFSKKTGYSFADMTL